MIVDIKQITGALAKVSAFASGEKNVPGVLLDIKEDYLNVCYSDGRKSVIEKIDVELSEDEEPKQIVLNYQRLVDIINVCQPTGRIHTDRVEFIIEGSIVKIRVEKKILQRESNEVEDEEYKTFSVFEQSISWVEANANLKVALLTRMDYSKIFEAEEEDAWDIADFRATLTKTSTEKNKVTYVSPGKECAFVANMAYLSCIPLGENHSVPMIFNSAVAKSLTDILGKVSDQDTIHVHVVDRKFCSIRTDDNSVGINVEMVDASKVHLTTLANYQAKGYKNYQLTFIKDILKNVVDAAMAADKADKTVLRFGKSTIDENEMVLKITSANSAASVSNDYTVVCAGYLDSKGDIDTLELPISLKVISEMLAKCDEDYVGIDIDVTINGDKAIRVADIDIEKRMEADGEVRERLNLNADEPTPIEEQLEYRDNTLGAKHYTISARTV